MEFRPKKSIMPKVRIVEATRHPGNGTEILRSVVVFLTATDKEIGRRTIDTTIAGHMAELQAAVLAEWEELQAATVQGLVGQEYTF